MVTRQMHIHVHRYKNIANKCSKVYTRRLHYMYTMMLNCSYYTFIKYF